MEGGRDKKSLFAGFMRSFFVCHRAGQFALGNQFPAIVMYADIPHMLAAPDMNGAAGGSDMTGVDWPQVVCRDDGSDSVVFVQVDAHQRCEASRRFRQDASRPAVQDAVHLFRAAVDRHVDFQVIGADFTKFYAEVIENIIRCDDALDFVDFVILEPYHGEYINHENGQMNIEIL